MTNVFSVELYDLFRTIVDIGLENGGSKWKRSRLIS